MVTRRILIMILALGMASIACGIHLNYDLPINEINPGKTVEQLIQVPLPANADTVSDLSLNFGAGELRLAPGAKDNLVTGSAVYNVDVLKPKIKTEGNHITIQSGEGNLKGIPSFNEKYQNNWDLKLADRPITLEVNAGAYIGNLDLGGLALHGLSITDGASDVHLKFSAPNQAEMDVMRYQTGASTVKLTNLANANFANLIFKGGAGDYTLDFSGELMQDTTVMVSAGLSNLTIIVPKGMTARVFFDGALANVDNSGEWEKRGQDYYQKGSGPVITLNINLGAGNVTLRNP